MTTSHAVNPYIQTEVMLCSYNTALNKNPEDSSVLQCVCVCVCVYVCVYVSMYVHVFVLDGTIYGLTSTPMGVS